MPAFAGMTGGDPEFASVRTIKRRDSMSMPPAGAGILVHDVHRQRV
jgi:hypothetical protein